MPTITVRLLKRSATIAAGNDTSMRGSVKATKAFVASTCDAAANATVPGVNARFLIAIRATKTFNALSLNAPRNWAKSSPRSGCLARVLPSMSPTQTVAATG